MASLDQRLSGLAGRVWNWLDRYWFGPTPAWPLAAFRMAYAVALICYFSDRISILDEFLGASAGRLPDLGGSEDSYLKFHQPLYLGPLSEWQQGIAVVSFYFLSLCLLVGYRSRLAAGALGVWIAGVSLVDWMGAFALNRTSVVLLALMAFMPLGKTWSVDKRLLALKQKGEPASGTGGEGALISAWPVRTLQWFLVVWYTMTGILKLQGDWSLFQTNDVLWTQIQGWYQNDLCWWVLNNVSKDVVGALQMGTIYFELFAPLWLILPWTRPFGVIYGLGMHWGIDLLMTKVGLFSLQMVSFYLLFLPLRLRGRR